MRLYNKSYVNENIMELNTQVDLLSRSVKEWNRWRDHNPDDVIDLQGAWLYQADLSDANLSFSNLDGARLDYAILERALFTGSSMSNVELIDSRMENAELIDVQLENSNLNRSILTKSKLYSANLKGANLIDADLRGANLGRADLQGACLVDTDLGGADLTNANLHLANLRFANLEKANLSGARGFILDRSYVRNTIFDPVASDPWSVLRRKYSGAAMLWTIMAMIASFFPYAVKAIYWAAFSRFQSTAMGIEYSEGTHESYNIIQMMFGFNESPYIWFLPVVLVFYNIIRAFLTYHVGPLRDAEERSGFSPAYTTNDVWIAVGGMTICKFWKGYKYLYVIHHYTDWLLWLSIIVALINASHWLLFQPIWVAG